MASTSSNSKKFSAYVAFMVFVVPTTLCPSLNVQVMLGRGYPVALHLMVRLLPHAAIAGCLEMILASLATTLIHKQHDYYLN